MTIIRPTFNKNYVRFFVLLAIVVLAGGIFYVFEYNSFVNTRYQVTTLKNKIADAETMSAGLKSTYYKMTDPVHLETLVPEYHLTLERRPDYLEQSKWVSDSSH